MLRRGGATYRHTKRVRSRRDKEIVQWMTSNIRS